MQSRIIAIIFAALLLEARSSVSQDATVLAERRLRNLRNEATQAFGKIDPAAEENLADPVALLGRHLFWDSRLSSDGKTACASCHSTAAWGADARRFSPDARGKNTSRNSQTVFNALLQPALRWTGDRRSGAHQAEKSLTGSLGFATADAVVPLLKELGYEAAFRAAFPEEAEPVSPTRYAAAIEAYEATLITPAPFDRFLAGDDAALTETQQTGLRIFLDSGCVDCHAGRLLGGGTIEKFGVVTDYWTATKSDSRDAGVAEVTKKDSDRYRFRVSMLRNIAKTAPYFHDGSVADLQEAVQVMADVQLGDRLDDSEAAAIVSFLHSLTGEVPVNYSQPETAPSTGGTE